MLSKRFVETTSFITLLAFLNLLAGCAYYKIAVPDDAIAELKQTDLSAKYVIIHGEKWAYHLDYAELNLEKNEIKGFITPIDERHMLFKKNENSDKLQYRESAGERPHTELHIFVKGDVEIKLMSEFSTSLNSIERVEVYEHDQLKTSMASVTIFGMVALAVIAAAFFLVNIFEEDEGRK